MRQRTTSQKPGQCSTTSARLPAPHAARPVAAILQIRRKNSAKVAAILQSGRLAQAVEALKLSPEVWVDRRQLEEALGVSKTVAWRIMRRCGATAGPGGSLVCPREDLIRQLRNLQNDGAVHEREIQHRERMDIFLSQVRPSVVANLTRVASGERAISLLSSTFRKLPPSVQLKPRSLRIEFSSAEDFLAAFGAVVYALYNNFEEIREWIDGSV